MAEMFAAALRSAAYRRFTILETDSGSWVARERGSAVERRFPNQKAAVHFVLFDLGAYSRAALLTPRSERVVGD